MSVTAQKDKDGKPIKKDGLQAYRVRVSYKNAFGEYKQVERTAYGKNAANRLEYQLEEEYKHKFKDDTRLTLNELWQQYAAAQANATKVSTQKNTVAAVNKHVLPLLGEKQLRLLTPPVLQEWKNTIDNGDLAIGTKKKIYRTFHALLEFAVKMDYLQVNPLNKLGNFTAPVDTSVDGDTMDFYTVEEFRRYIAAAYAYAKEKNTIAAWSCYVFFCIAFYTGARKGEIRALRWCDIKDGCLSIIQSMNDSNVVTAPKNKSSIRSIGIPAPLHKILTAHKERCSSAAAFTDECFICGGLRAISHTYLHIRNIDFATVAGLRVIRVHDFRHSHASLLINNGISIQEVARRLGHSDVTTTMNIYAHLYPSEKERALTVLNGIDVE